MSVLVLLVTLAAAPHHRLVLQPNLARPSAPLPVFQFAPVSGAGMGVACACATPTGTRGESMVFSRASSGTCLKGGTTTGIVDGDMVTCSSGQPRIMPGGSGTGPLGMLVEEVRVNLCLRSAELCDAAWADVGTPNCVADQAIGPLGTTTMDRLTDNDAAALEGRSQLIATTSATRHSVSCFVKAGTATSASITLVGTGNGAGDCTGTATGLSATTSTRVSCTSPAGYTAALTAVTVSVLVGTVVGDQGTLFVEGCQHEVGPAGSQGAPYPSSYIATAGASATRAADSAYFQLGPENWSTVSIAASVLTAPLMTSSWSPFELWYTNTPDNHLIGLNGSVIGTTQVLTGRFRIAGTSNNVNSVATCTGGNTCAFAIYYDGAARASCVDGACTATAGVLALPVGSPRIYIGGREATTSALEANGVVSRVCVDPSPTRCR